LNDPLQNIATITDGVAKLSEVLSKGVGGMYAPTQIKRVAKARIEVEKAAFDAEKEILQTIEENPNLFSKENLLVRAIIKTGYRLTIEQDNIDSIIQQAYVQIDSIEANDHDIEDDWLSEFFEKVKNVSDKDIQFLWGQILAGEVATPGVFSMYTLNMLKQLDKTSAEKLIKFIKLSFDGVICSTKTEVLNKFGLTVLDFTILQDMGWIGQHDIIRKTIKEGSVAVPIQGTNYFLYIINSKEFTLSFTPLTRASIEISNIKSYFTTPQDKFFFELAKPFKEKGCEVHLAVKSGMNQYKFIMDL